jgi:RNA polymerase sigma-70 factor (ECF subfamily)
MRDVAEADEAVQDAFVKAFSHLSSFREELPFEVWFTRILINGPAIASRRGPAASVGSRRCRTGRPGNGFRRALRRKHPSPEDQLLARERRERLAQALVKLPERQRSVFMLSHYEGCTSREVSALTGLNESTVRVHLFRAIRKLRTLLVDGRASETKVVKRRVHS